MKLRFSLLQLTNGSGQFERADKTHMGFAEPYWPEEKR